MCTDEQWTPRAPTQTMMISRFWIPNAMAKTFNRNEYTSFWLSPMDVPYGEKSFKWSFPSFSSVCKTHTPAKLR